MKRTAMYLEKHLDTCGCSLPRATAFYLSADDLAKISAEMVESHFGLHIFLMTYDTILRTR